MIKTLQTIRISCIAAVLSLLLYSVINSQTIILFTEPGSFDAYTPLWINLDDVTTLDEFGLQLVEISGKTKLPVAQKSKSYQ